MTETKEKAASGVTLKALTQQDAERFELALEPAGSVINLTHPFSLAGSARLVRAAIAAGWIEEPSAGMERVKDQKGREYTRYLLDGRDIDELDPRDQVVFRLGLEIQALWLSFVPALSTRPAAIEAVDPGVADDASGDGASGDDAPPFTLKERFVQRDVERFERELELLGGVVFPIGRQSVEMAFSLVNYGRLARAAIAAGWIAEPEGTVETVTDQAGTRKRYKLGDTDIATVNPAEQLVYRLGSAVKTLWLTFVTLPNG